MGGEGKVEGWEKNVKKKTVGGNIVKNLKQNRRSIDPLKCLCQSQRDRRFQTG